MDKPSAPGIVESMKRFEIGKNCFVHQRKENVHVYFTMAFLSSISMS